MYICYDLHLVINQMITENDISRTLDEIDKHIREEYLAARPKKRRGHGSRLMPRGSRGQ
jgi:hypothetical protein